MEISFTERSELVKQGKLLMFDVAMRPIPDERMRTIRVWLPPLYDGTRRFPVLYMHDGQVIIPDREWADLIGGWKVDEIIPSLEPEIQCIVVAIDHSDDRGSELLPPYTRNPSHMIPRPEGQPEYVPLGHYYADFVRDTLKPIIDGNFRTKPDAANTGVGGASMGGLQSYYMTMKDPDVFGRSFDLSPGMDILDESCLSLIDSYDPKRLENVRFYMCCGDQEIEETIMTSTITVYRRMKHKLHLDSRHLRAVIDTREYHWNSSWSRFLEDGIRYLFSEDNSVDGPPDMSRFTEKK